MDENGSITPYLIITLTASLLILFLLVDFGRVNYLKNETRRDGELAIESELALYNKELKEEYGLFACVKQEDYELEDDIKELMERNIENTKVDNYEVKSVELIDDISLMDDDELERQINSFMKYRNIECDFNSIFSILSSSSKKQKEIKKEILMPCTEDEYADIESYKDRDNREHASSLLEKQIEDEDVIMENYELVAGDETTLDNIAKRSEEMIEECSRDLNKDKLVNYVMLVFNNTQSIKNENRFWKAETEFIISGTNSQNKNIENTYEKIRLLLLPERLIEVYSDEERKSEAELIAMATCGWWSGEIGVTIAKNAILISMAIEDTEDDLNSLNSGESVNLIKGSSIYLNYEDFLKILLMFEDKKEILDRIRIMIDANLKEVNGIFDISKTKCGMLFKVTSKSKFIFTTSIPNLKTKLNEFEFEENIFGVY